jgi:tRNA(fMet)-specific endonuclease VapC
VKYLLDTNILIHYLRQSKLADYTERTYQPLTPSPTTTPLISTVIVGELESLALRNNWGTPRKKELELLLDKFLIVDIRIKTIINRYAEIDAFSYGKLKGRPLVGSARTMGKNDLWIAATASVLDATLLTTDKDFNHLNNLFLDVVWIDPLLHKS